ncbi:MAG: hypothetical protein K6G03_01990 [Lachnospiraceae bacterium]|nr:hypothetical protein [Lachnospiraceae bacterium]
MAVRFVLNDEFVAEVDEDLMREYRKMMEIPEEMGDSAVLQDIMYNDIIGTEYYPDEAEEWIKSLKELALFYNFKNAGELLEYFMHKAMETKMDICANCNKFRDGVCLEDGRKTSPYYMGCDTLNKRSMTPERIAHNQKIYDYIAGKTDVRPKEMDIGFI